MTSLAKECNVNASTISTILSSKAKILEHYEKSLAGPEKKRIKLSSYDDADRARSTTNNPVEQDSNAEIEDQQDANKQAINSKEAIDRINEMKQFFFYQKR
ncbi:hypothetical protein BpHYR1_040969 [Brachionus plicatilis]|uniref:Uncharacterized protein n=1 Tax=Brachionus plicatilis TaxID=10195 RepID=A0A3M7SDZ9_BRAPC|nr:hypothetical protein BpHYR1_040969 [Brachionus plicatilis]